MNKKNLIILVSILLIGAGFIALTQETDLLPDNIEARNDIPKPPKWFISNAGGMALEEVLSKSAALRNEYALSITRAIQADIPYQIVSFFYEGFSPEIRVLYKNGEQIRVQWLFIDEAGFTRLNAVIEDKGEKFDFTGKNGFLEVFDNNYFLITEYRFYKDRGANRIDYTYNDNLLTSCAYLVSENAAFQAFDINEGYMNVFTDLYRYNRSLSLRAIERVFSDIQINADDYSRIQFPRNIMAAARNTDFVSERPNQYSDFFGDVYADDDNRMIYEMDERGRILTQSLLDDNGKIIWVIKNVWKDNRIASSVKTEGNTVSLAEYEYNSAGERITERNYKNGMLERIVRTNGKTDIEELYFNNILILRAVWEDGRKISETRIR